MRRSSSWSSPSRFPFCVYLLLAILFSQTLDYGWAQTRSSGEQEKTRKQADLSLAAGTGNIASAKYFLEHGADVNGAYLGGVTPYGQKSQTL
jgi:hypothetical protein